MGRRPTRVDWNWAWNRTCRQGYPVHYATACLYRDSFLVDYSFLVCRSGRIDACGITVPALFFAFNTHTGPSMPADLLVRLWWYSATPPAPLPWVLSLPYHTVWLPISCRAHPDIQPTRLYVYWLTYIAYYIPYVTPIATGGRSCLGCAPTTAWPSVLLPTCGIPMGYCRPYPCSKLWRTTFVTDGNSGAPATGLFVVGFPYLLQHVWPLSPAAGDTPDNIYSATANIITHSDSFAPHAPLRHYRHHATTHRCLTHCLPYAPCTTTHPPTTTRRTYPCWLDVPYLIYKPVDVEHGLQ